MKTLRIALAALALSALAAVASLSTVSAGDTTHKGSYMQAGPIPTCPPNDPNGCGIYGNGNQSK